MAYLRHIHVSSGLSIRVANCMGTDNHKWKLYTKIFKKSVCGLPLLFGITRRMHVYMLELQAKIKYAQYRLCSKTLSISTVCLVRFYFVFSCYSNTCADSTTRECINNNLYCVYFVCVLVADKSSRTNSCQTRERNNVPETNWPTDHPNT